MGFLENHFKIVYLKYIVFQYIFVSTKIFNLFFGNFVPYLSEVYYVPNSNGDIKRVGGYDVLIESYKYSRSSN